MNDEKRYWSLVGVNSRYGKEEPKINDVELISAVPINGGDYNAEEAARRGWVILTNDQLKEFVAKAIDAGRFNVFLAVDEFTPWGMVPWYLR